MLSKSCVIYAPDFLKIKLELELLSILFNLQTRTENNINEYKEFPAI